MTDMTAYPYPSAPAPGTPAAGRGRYGFSRAGPGTGRRAGRPAQGHRGVPPHPGDPAPARLVRAWGRRGLRADHRGGWARWSPAGCPRFAATYLSGYLRWYARVGGYLLLLTDEYPPFTLGDADFPVRLAVGSGKLNRLTVLFRGILAIPVAIVWLLLSFGLAVAVIFIGWPTALIAALPAAVHQALASVLRYSIRYNGYVYLLTGAYPAGLFGDASGHWAGGAGASGEDASPRLALSPGARRLVGLMLVLGLLTGGRGGGWRHDQRGHPTRQGDQSAPPRRRAVQSHRRAAQRRRHQGQAGNQPGTARFTGGERRICGARSRVEQPERGFRPTASR